MLVGFESLQQNSRVWIYQSSRLLSNVDQDIISARLADFIHSWTAHQAGLKGAFEIRYNLFLIIAVDQDYNNASGCSIDKKVNFIKELGKDLNIDFFDRLQIAYKDEAGDIHTAHMSSIKELFSSGVINENTKVFNNLITTVKDLSDNWEVAIGNSWLGKILAGVR